MTSGRRKEPPISTNWPRETITSLPAATVLSTIAVAAALLLTTVAASAPVSMPEEFFDPPIAPRLAGRWPRRSARPSSPTAPRHLPQGLRGQHGPAQARVEDDSRGVDRLADNGVRGSP